VLGDRAGGLVDDSVRGLAPLLERQVEARKLELQPEHLRLEHAQCGLEELLTCLITLEDDDRARIHSAAL
jgi:hypothetical protein